MTVSSDSLKGVLSLGNLRLREKKSGPLKNIVEDGCPCMYREVNNLE